MKYKLKNARLKVRHSSMLFLLFSILSLTLFFSCKKKSSSEPIFSFNELISQNPLDLNITTDLDVLFEKSDVDNYQKATCTFANGATMIHEGKMKLKKRGITRKKICDMPPLMLKFGSGSEETQTQNGGTLQRRRRFPTTHLQRIFNLSIVPTFDGF